MVYSGIQRFQIRGPYQGPMVLTIDMGYRVSILGIVIVVLDRYLAFGTWDLTWSLQ